MTKSGHPKPVADVAAYSGCRRRRLKPVDHPLHGAVEGIVVAMQNEKSQLQNREAAMRVLRARLLAKQAEEAAAEASAHRSSQIRTMDRSERIRTYNFPENRIADHRTGYKAYNLDAVMNGALEPVIESCIRMDEEDRLQALGS